MAETEQVTTDDDKTLDAKQIQHDNFKKMITHFGSELEKLRNERDENIKIMTEKVNLLTPIDIQLIYDECGYYTPHVSPTGRVKTTPKTNIATEPNTEPNTKLFELKEKVKSYERQLHSLRLYNEELNSDNDKYMIEIYDLKKKLEETVPTKSSDEDDADKLKALQKELKIANGKIKGFQKKIDKLQSDNETLEDFYQAHMNSKASEMLS